MTRDAGRQTPATAGAAVRFGWPAFACGLWMLATSAAGWAQPGARELAERREDLGDLRQRIEAMRKELAAAEASRSDATDQLRESEQQISKVRRDMQFTAAEQKSVERQLTQLRGEQARLGAQIAEQQQQIASLLRRQYLSGATDPLKRIFSGQSPQQVARDLVYLGTLAEARQSLAASLANKKAQAKALAERAQAQSAALADLAKAHSEAQASLDRQRQARQKMLDKVAADVSARRKEIGTLRRDEQRLTTLINRLGKLLAARPKPPPPRPQGASPAPGIASGPLPDKSLGGGPFASLRGRLRLPVTGVVTHRFGTPREGGQWKGLFVKSTAGSEIRAIAPGRVVFAEWMRGFGNLLILDHGDDYLSIYGHNEALLLQVGETVAAGDPIASVGSTGGRAETGLYFELRHRGQAIDPLAWVAPR